MSRIEVSLLLPDTKSVCEFCHNCISENRNNNYNIRTLYHFFVEMRDRGSVVCEGPSAMKLLYVVVALIFCQEKRRE